jgi:preprotein translocase subunit SecA
MTGTAEQAAEEFHDFYGLRVAVLATHQRCIRVDEQDQLYASRDAKVEALVRHVVQLHRTGQPVLVGTADVRESDQLGDRLRAAHIPCRILNAKNDHEEASIIADAGTYGAVTIATNMAGRGTDIRLGGHDARDGSRVKSLGGLYVIGTNRHESRRIDNQLRGRSGRQGDPGRSRFIVSLEDNLLRRFGVADALRNVAVNEHSSEQLDDAQVTEKVAHIQRVVEGECFEIRRTLRKYSEVLETQRQAIAKRRRTLLLNQSPTYILPERAADRYEDIAQRFGNAVLRRVEQQITLFQIDRCWADHLGQMAEARESIHLFSLGGLDPFYEYQARAGKAYRDLQQHIDDEVVAKFNTVEITADGIDLQGEDLIGPSSTWTYMISDHPAGDLFDRLSRSVKRLLARG